MNSCLSSITLERVTFSGNILLFDYLSVNQTLINLLYTRYSRMRDFYNFLDTLSTTAQVAIFIAQAINASLVSVKEIKPYCPKEFFNTNPALYYHVSSYALQEVHNKIRRIHGQTAKPTTIQRYTTPYSYSFCSHPRPRKDSETLNPFLLFSDTADVWVWISLLTLLIVVSLLVQFNAKTSTFSIPLTVFSALLCSGVSFNQKYIRHSWLFTLWMSGCLIFVTYYSGHLTSHVAKPAEDFRYAKVEDLLKNNYTMVANPYSSLVIKNFVRTASTLRIAKVLAKLIESAGIMPINESSGVIVHRNNYACASSCPTSFNILKQANKLIKRNNLRDRHCYIVKETILGQSIYTVVSPPKKANMDMALSAVMEQGIFDIWFREFVGISSSSRVQAKPKIITLTKVVEDKEIPQPLLLTRGNLKNVFVLWATYLSFCAMVFLLEKSWGFC